jgi:hypothetical protein
MTRIMVVLTADTERRRLLGGVNVRCPECPRIAARDEGQRAAWCRWCACWFCSPRCARRHRCPALRNAFHAARAALDRLLGAA